MNKVNVLWFVFFGMMNGKPRRMMKFKGNMRRSWSNQLMKMLGRWPWRNLKMKMNAKEEVLSIRIQMQWRNSRINDESFHEVFQVQHISKVRMEAHIKNTISLSTPRRRGVFNSREKRILTQYEAWSKHFHSKWG